MLNVNNKIITLLYFKTIVLCNQNIFEFCPNLRLLLIFKLNYLTNYHMYTYIQHIVQILQM